MPIKGKMGQGLELDGTDSDYILVYTSSYTDNSSLLDFTTLIIPLQHGSICEVTIPHTRQLFLGVSGIAIHFTVLISVLLD